MPAKELGNKRGHIGHKTEETQHDALQAILPRKGQKEEKVGTEEQRVRWQPLPGVGAAQRLHIQENGEQRTDQVDDDRNATQVEKVRQEKLQPLLRMQAPVE